MSRIALGAFAFCALGFSASAHAQELSDFYADGCPESLVTRWCPPLLSKEGWKLRYKAESPRDLMDVYWLYEIWMRERAAVVCAFLGGRAGIRENGCKTLNEVEP
jgi:hypothetical protein